jgi:uncharacterized LabA/DUF88 family protein
VIVTDAWVLIDYQNVHRSAFESFTAYGTPLKDAQIHPVQFANQAAKKIRESTGEALDITKILVFRGVPSPRKERRLNAIVSRQHRTWSAHDRRVEMRTRPLRYLRDWPDSKAEEKGIDVLLAVTLVEAALRDSADRFIVATRDTDLLPAIELAQSIHSGCVDIVTWDGQSQLAVDDVSTHVMGEAAYRASRDLHNYGAEVP